MNIIRITDYRIVICIEEDIMDIVTYKNEFNTVPLRDFRAVEMDLLFSIMSRMRNEQTNQVTLDFEDLKALSNYKVTARHRFLADLERTYDKLINLNIKVGTSDKWTKFVFFTEYTVDASSDTVTIKTNAKFAYLINDLDSNFTRLELEEITSLTSSYSKALYRQLKQFRATGVAMFRLDDFRERMCIPESYEMYNINQKVINPSVAALQKFFKNLKCKRIKGTGRDKRKTVRLEFTFDSNAGLQKDGKRTFRDNTGNYYDKHLYDFNKDEIDKAFPDYPRHDNQDNLDGQISVDFDNLG